MRLRLSLFFLTSNLFHSIINIILTKRVNFVKIKYYKNRQNMETNKYNNPAKH